MSRHPIESAPKWIAASLVLAGIYNLAWGGVVIASPALFFQWAEMPAPRYPEIWQCVGMVVGVYGIGYLIAAGHPSRHWPIVLVAMVGKVLGPIGFVFAATSGRLPWAFGWTIIGNDLIWWIPFTCALYYAWRDHSDSSPSEHVSFSEAIKSVVSHRGATLHSLSMKGPTMVIFLRHAGCTFCREALADLQANRERIRSLGVEIALVHMGSPIDATMLFERYDLQNVHRFSDPHCVLYDAFDVDRGNLSQVLGPRVWWRGLFVAVVEGHGMGPVQGDVFRMPATFALRDGEILESVRSNFSSDRLDYLATARRLANADADRSAETEEAVTA